MTPVGLAGLLWAIRRETLGPLDRTNGLQLVLCIYGTSHIILVRSLLVLNLSFLVYKMTITLAVL